MRSPTTRTKLCPIAAETKKDQSWFFSGWRPALGWSYVLVCTFDFVIFPMIYALFQALVLGGNIDQIKPWSPLTIQGGGLYHISMLAIVGATSFGRTKEKMLRFTANSAEMKDG